MIQTCLPIWTDKVSYWIFFTRNSCYEFQASYDIFFHKMITNHIRERSYVSSACYGVPSGWQSSALFQCPSGLLHQCISTAVNWECSICNMATRFKKYWISTFGELWKSWFMTCSLRTTLAWQQQLTTYVKCLSFLKVSNNEWYLGWEV